MKRRLLEEEENETRFTDLPESLQLHIFSSVETKHAIQTLMLSKSWGCSWTSIPVLRFNSYTGFDGLDAFDWFVDDVLSLREPVKLEKLSFKRGGTCESMILKNVLDYALSHGVKELEMDITQDGECGCNWPFWLHASSEYSVTNLKLASSERDMGCLFLERRAFLFKNVTNLHLERVIITDPDLFSHELLALDKLTLVHCPLKTNGNVLNIHAPRLSELTISNNSHVNRYELTTPKLQYFEYRGALFPLLMTRQGGLPILKTVVLDYNGHCSQGQEKILFDDVLVMFNALSNVKSLTVFWSIVNLLSFFPDDLVWRHSPFQDLKCLKLDFSLFYAGNSFEGRTIKTWSESMKLVPDVKAYFLRNSPDAQCSIIHPV